MTPRCYNRPPFAAGRTEHGISRDTGARVETYLSNAWFTDSCKTWSGVGIGQNNERYPVAHGWDCRGCRWLPDEFKQDAAIAAHDRLKDSLANIMGGRW